jgi:hypothetical protein
MGGQKTVRLEIKHFDMNLFARSHGWVYLPPCHWNEPSQALVSYVCVNGSPARLCAVQDIAAILEIDARTSLRCGRQVACGLTSSEHCAVAALRRALAACAKRVHSVVADLGVVHLEIVAEGEP